MSKRLVVTSPIYFGDPGRGALAYSVGQTVDADAVKANGWQDFVAGEGTKAADAAKE